MIGVAPPEYFPPLPYTAFVRYVDHFILADTFRYRGHKFQDCSKLRNAQGAHWITIPLFGRPEGARFHKVEIETGGRWREKHWRSFMYDYRTTMYFEFYEDSFQPFFEVEWTNLAQCCCRSVELQADLFGIDTQLTRASQLKGAPTTLVGIAEVLEADRVVVAASGEVPAGSDLRIETFAYGHPTYRQNFEGFVSGVTAMDLLFNYGREAPRILAQGIPEQASLE